MTDPLPFRDLTELAKNFVRSTRTHILNQTLPKGKARVKYGSLDSLAESVRVPVPRDHVRTFALRNQVPKRHQLRSQFREKRDNPRRAPATRRLRRVNQHSPVREIDVPALDAKRLRFAQAADSVQRDQRSRLLVGRRLQKSRIRRAVDERLPTLVLERTALHPLERRRVQKFRFDRLRENPRNVPNDSGSRRLRVFAVERRDQTQRVRFRKGRNVARTLEKLEENRRRARFVPKGDRGVAESSAQKYASNNSPSVKRISGSSRPALSKRSRKSTSIDSSQA